MAGIIGTTFDSAALIRSVVGARSLTMALYHRDVGGRLQLVGRAGANPAGRSPGYSKRTSLGESWMVRVTGTASGSTSADAQGLLGLGFGLLVTVLALLLYRALSRSRQQAWGLVGEKTDELEYRALHDPLTGLPNRSLVLDRAEQILARARRLDVQFGCPRQESNLDLPLRRRLWRHSRIRLQLAVLGVFAALFGPVRLA